MRLRSLAIAAALALVMWVDVCPRADEPSHGTLRIGYVGAGEESTPNRGLAKFWTRLGELGWVEGRNLVVERRWAEGHTDRYPSLMEQMVARKVDVIVTAGTSAALAAKRATSTIPIVVMSMGDALGTGLAKSLARPEGNLTGFSHAWREGFAGKWLELLQETNPRLKSVAVIYNPQSPLAVQQVSELEANAPLRRLKVTRIELRTPQSLPGVFERAERRAQAVVVLTDPLTWQHQREVSALAIQHRLPSIFSNVEFVDAGGLMAYGIDLAAVYPRAAEYVDKILRGTKPADLPIEQPRQVAFVVNLQTAKALGIEMPQSVLLRADEVIK